MKRPLFLIDLDGPLNPFLSWTAADEDYQHISAGHSTWMLHLKHGQWLAELSQHVEIMWASTWEATANELANTFYGLPPFKYVVFGKESMRTGLPFKLREVQEIAKGRTLIWIEDEVEDEMLSWVQQRSEPTLLIIPNPRTGWTEEQYVECLNFLNQQ